MIKKILLYIILVIPFLSYGNTITLNVPSAYYPNPSILGYQPGDTIKFVGQNPSQIFFQNLNGTPDKFVVITADSGIVIGGGTSRNIEFTTSNYIEVYNLTINGHGNNKFGIINHYSSNFKYKKIYIDSCNLGLQHKSDPNFSDPNTYWPNYKMMNISIYDVHIKHINNEAFYLGQTYSGATGQDSTKPPAPIFGLSIENSSTDSTGWDGFQVTGAFNVYMSNITAKWAGLLGQSGQAQGVTIQDNTNGVFENMQIDTSNAAGLNIFSIGPVLYRNINIRNASYAPKTNLSFVDNRHWHGIRTVVPIARTLYMQNISVTNAPAGLPNYALNVNNNTSATQVSALRGQVRNLTFVPSDYKFGVSDNVNDYVGGTIGSPVTSPTYVYVTQYYKGFFKDVLKVPVISDLAIRPLDPMFLYAKDTVGYLTLKWDTTKSNGGSTLLSYEIYKSNDSISWSKIGSVPTNTLAFIDNGVADSAYYYYRVLAKTSVGESWGFNAFRHRYIPPPPPVPPTIPDAPSNLSGSGGNGFVTLTWAVGSNGNSPLTNYNIYRGTVSGSTSFLTTASASSPTFTDATVTNETRYYYTVTAENVIGESPKSNEATAFPTAFTVPTAPTNPVATPGNTQVNVSWSAPLNNGGSTIVNYKVYRGTVNGGSKNLIRTVNGSTFSITDTGRTNGTTYYYAISAVNGIGESPVSTQVSATPN